MRLSVAIEWFDAPNGAATYAHNLAGQLQRLGHEVAIVTNHPGAMAEIAAESGVVTCEPPEEAPDVVLPQDPMIAVDLAERWPATPQVYIAHGAETDQGVPPTLHGITAAAVAMNARVERRLAGHAAFPRVVRLHQPIDVERFRRRGRLPAEPRRVLLLGNYLRGTRREAIVDVCAQAGLEVLHVGEHGRGMTLHPQEEIARADIVIGYGRSILEAMSCGRAAYILDDLSGDGWVTPESYPALEADGFAGTAFDVATGPDTLAGDLSAYHPGMGDDNRNLILRHHRATTHTSQVAAVCAEVLGDPPRRHDPPADAARLARALWDAEWRLRQVARQLAAADDHRGELERRLEDAERRAADAEGRLAAFRETRRYRTAQALGRPLDRLRSARRGD
jgi:hypothetical protein